MRIKDCFSKMDNRYVSISLVEIILAITLFVFACLTIVSVIAFVIQDSSMSAHRAKSYFLAEEATEIVKDLRESFVLDSSYNTSEIIDGLKRETFIEGMYGLKNIRTDLSWESGRNILSINQILDHGRKTDERFVLDFDGVTNYVTTSLTPYGIHDSVTGDMTLSMWGRYEGNGTQCFLCADVAGGDRFYVSSRNDKTYGVGISNWLEDFNVETTKEWRHIVITIEGTTGIIYLDGAFVGKREDIVLNYPDKVIELGRGEEAFYFKGSLSDVRIYDRALSNDEVFALYQGLSIPVQGLVAYWKLDEEMGLNIFDYSGNDNYGLLHGDVNRRPFLINKWRQSALKFDGETQYVKVGENEDIANLDGLNTPFSVSFWAKPQFISYSGFVQMWGVDAPYEFLMSTNGMGGGLGRARARIWKPEPRNAGIVSIPLDEWHHFVWTFDGYRIKGYLNGSLARNLLHTEEGVALDFSGKLTFGLYSWQDNYLDGYLDDIRIYGRELSIEEIELLYQGMEISSVELAGRWNFDENTGVLVQDISGNGNHGFLVNSPSWEYIDR